MALVVELECLWSGVCVLGLLGSYRGRIRFSGGLRGFTISICLVLRVGCPSFLALCFLPRPLRSLMPSFPAIFNLPNLGAVLLTFYAQGAQGTAMCHRATTELLGGSFIMLAF